MKNKNSCGSVELICAKKDKHKRSRPYRVRFTVDWEFDYENLKVKAIRETVGYSRTISEGNKIRDEYRDGLLGKDMSNVSLKYLFGLWYEYKKKTIVDYKSYLSMFKKYKKIEKKAFISITTDDLQRIVDGNLKNLTGGYQKKVISIYSQIYEYAKASNIKVGANVSKLVVTKKKEDKSDKHKTFTDNTIKIFWQNKGNKVIDLVLICIYTGMRPSEMLVISEVHDNYIISGSKTEAGKNRIIPLHEGIRDIFHNAWEKKYFDDYSSEDSFYHVFEKTIQKLNLDDDYTPYDTRHTFCTLADRYGMDEHITKLIIGHRIEDLTKRVYTHKTIEDLIKEVNKIVIIKS